MKNLVKIALLSAGTFIAGQSFAQTHKSVGHQIGHAAKDVGHKTSELAAKGAAGVTDKRYKDHFAPSGENVYIDKNARYFYVDKRGHRQFLKKAELRYKPYKH